jgi:hypothetical protein
VIARSMLAGAALFALVAGSTAVAELPDSEGPLRLTEKRYVDGKGNTLVLRFDGPKKGKGVKAKATDKDGKPLDVLEMPLKDLTVCVPKAGATTPAATETAKPLCQPLAFVTDGAVIKMGTATCTCQVIGGYVYCYGDTCH